MKTMNKRERIEQYNKANPGYAVTGIKKMTLGEIANYRKYGASSLYDLYVRPSYTKEASYSKIMHDYQPREIIAVQGSSHSYSVLLRAGNGDLFHITHANNYLIEEV